MLIKLLHIVMVCVEAFSNDVLHNEYIAKLINYFLNEINYVCIQTLLSIVFNNYPSYNLCSNATVYGAELINCPFQFQRPFLNSSLERKPKLKNIFEKI